MKKRVFAFLAAMVFSVSLLSLTASAITSSDTIKKDGKRKLFLEGSGYSLESYYDCGSTGWADDAQAWANVTTPSDVGKNSVELKMTNAHSGRPGFGEVIKDESHSGKGRQNVDCYPNGIDYMTGYCRSSYKDGADKTSLTVTN